MLYPLKSAIAFVIIATVFFISLCYSSARADDPPPAANNIRFGIVLPATDRTVALQEAAAWLIANPSETASQGSVVLFYDNTTQSYIMYISP